MSDQTLRPIWTPDDARQTAIDAARHRGERGVENVDPYYATPDDDGAPLPFRRNVKAICPCCSAWPLEVCEPGCLSLMTPEEQQQHREDVLEATIAELDRLEALPDPPAPSRFPDEYHAQAGLYRQNADPGAFVIAPGRHRAEPVAGLSPWRVAIAVGVVVLVLGVGALWAAAKASAVPPNCQQQFWLMLGANTRTICDDPLRPDGSWVRYREFWSPAYRVPLRTSCSGGYSWRCTTTGGYVQESTSKGVESYTVTPATVLHDEPGHLA